MYRWICHCTIIEPWLTNEFPCYAGSGILRKRKAVVSGPPSLTLEGKKSLSVTTSTESQSSPPSISPQRSARASSRQPASKQVDKADNQLSKQVALNKTTTKSSPSEQATFTHGIGSVPGLFKRKLQDGELAAVPSAAQGHRQVEGATVHKYVNTPNGLSYPVTPPVTPDHGGDVYDERSADMVRCTTWAC